MNAGSNKIGHLAFVNAGHDAGTTYLIVGETENRYYLVDGKNRPVEKPKIKNKQHVKVMNHAMPEDILRAILQKQGGSDEAIRREIKQYRKEEE